MFKQVTFGNVKKYQDGDEIERKENRNEECEISKMLKRKGDEINVKNKWTNTHFLALCSFWLTMTVIIFYDNIDDWIRTVISLRELRASIPYWNFSRGFPPQLQDECEATDFADYHQRPDFIGKMLIRKGQKYIYFVEKRALKRDTKKKS